jgi:DNA gyrase/topoisomerase IV subunit B
MTKTPGNTIKKLTPYQHVRHRTEMYFGAKAPHTQVVMVYKDGQPMLKETIWVPSCYTSIREIIDNALDEMIGHNHGNRLEVSYDPKTMVFEVSDNGRGIPIDFDKEHGCHTATLALTHVMTGRNFDERGETAGTNGIGASGTVFTSEWFQVEILRDNKIFTQEFSEGDEVFGDQLKILDPKIKAHKSPVTGTKIRFKPSTNVFQKFILPLDFIQSRVYEIALANPLLQVFFNGERVKVRGTPEKSIFANRNPIIVPIKEGSFRSVFYVVPGFVQEGDHYHSIVNNIPAFDGGVHIDAFRRKFFGQFLTSLEKEAKKRKLNPNRSDVTEGILVYNITNMVAPNFNSQSKTRLTNEECGKIVDKELNNEEIYKNILSKHKEWINEIFERCADRTNKKDLGDIAKAAKAVARKKVPKLSDATGTMRKNCILLIGEGDSAIDGAMAVRDPVIHGGLPLRGKVMNAREKSNKEVMDNKELQDIMNATGLVMGQKAERNRLRYGKIFIAHDADEDGKNIGALLVNFFFKYWPELFDPTQEAYLNIFNTPFIIARKGKTNKYWYSHNYDQFNPDEYKGWEITRAKGLGTLRDDDWEHSLTKPDLTPIVDDGKMESVLDLLFNKLRADDRKSWLGLHDE